MLIRVLQGCLFYGVILGAIALSAGCASMMNPSNSGRYERLTQVYPSPGGSLFEAMTTIAGQLDDNWETNAGLAVHKGCRTNAVFDKYHVRYLYEQLKSRFAEVGVNLLHEKGYIYMAVPMEGDMPDSRTLTHLGTILKGKERVQLFIPQNSPFGHPVSRRALSDLREKLVRSGMGKDHILLLPSDSFGLPSAMNTATNVMALKICYS